VPIAPKKAFFYSLNDWRCAAAAYQLRRLKNCTSRSCFSAAARVVNVPKLRRWPVLGFLFDE
jgi:hypothetical protein